MIASINDTHIKTLAEPFCEYQRIKIPVFTEGDAQNSGFHEYSPERGAETCRTLCNSAKCTQMVTCWCKALQTQEHAFKMNKHVSCQDLMPVLSVLSQISGFNAN
jgi:hypothetical protein